MIHEDASQVLNLHDKELLLVLSNVGMEMGRGKRERKKERRQLPCLLISCHNTGSQNGEDLQ